MAFGEVGVDLEFRGQGADEVGVVSASRNPEYEVPPGKEVVKIDRRYYRPAEVELLIGDATKARTQLGWRPKYDLSGLVSEMVASDIELFKRDQYLRQGGHSVPDYHE